jgi:hypothetical protein
MQARVHLPSLSWPLATRRHADACVIGIGMVIQHMGGRGVGSMGVRDGAQFQRLLSLPHLKNFIGGSILLIELNYHGAIASHLGSIDQ